ncbi:unnamed protein product [Cladocopium goreaui]|uniref:Uncharacterized protein n=1 Tax=Cladocopium goreaui TaxID=2562237 RepID=A0A9P1CRG3_9DINO|nr:unnamed protein product [Cladocopium goreaui]
MRADARSRPGRPKARHGICAVLCTWHQNHGVYIVFLHTTIQKHWYIEWASARVPPTPSSLWGAVTAAISAASLQAARRVSENRKVLKMLPSLHRLRVVDLAGLDVIWQSEIRDIIAQKSAWRRKNWSEAP